jgi:hypothetical protein
MMPGYEPYLPSIQLHTYLRRRPELKPLIIETIEAIMKEDRPSPIVEIKVDLGNLDGDENFSALKFRLLQADETTAERTFNIEPEVPPPPRPVKLVEGEPHRIW